MKSRAGLAWQKGHGPAVDLYDIYRGKAHREKLTGTHKGSDSIREAPASNRSCWQ